MQTATPTDVITSCVRLFWEIVWWVLLAVLLFIYFLPPFLELLRLPWTSHLVRDPFLPYLADGASLSLGTGIYLTNHPGTPLHEVFALSTWLFRGSLGMASPSHRIFSASEMRSWIQLYPQSFVFVNRFISVAGYLGLFAAAVGLSKRLWGNRWVGFVAFVLFAESPFIRFFSVTPAMESFYPAVLIYATACCITLGTALTIPAICTACFWIALLLSLKLIHLPLAFVFLVFLYLNDRPGEIEYAPHLRRIADFCVWPVLPVTLLLTSLGVVSFKHHTKITAGGQHKLFILMALSAVWLMLPVVFLRTRRFFKSTTTNVSLLLMIILFLVINIPMAWKAWVGFLLNAGEQGFDWSYVAYFGNVILSDPLRLWAFAMSLSFWGLLAWRPDSFLSKNRFENSFYWVLPMPLYFLWVIQYTIRDYNVIPFDLLAVLFACSCIGFWMNWIRTSVRNRRCEIGPHRLVFIIALTVLWPALGGRLNLCRDVSEALQRSGAALSDLNRGPLQTFNQGTDPHYFYDSPSRTYLLYANAFSAFRFPLALSDSAQQRREQTLSLDQRHP